MLCGSSPKIRASRFAPSSGRKPTMGDYEFFIELPLASEWSSVDLIRTSVQNCLTAIFRDLDGCHVVAMITGELLENAVKYGDWSADSRRFRLRVNGSQGK